jgi:hypothetical protein
MHGHGGGGLAPSGTIRRNGTLNRGKTLSRPDRFQNPETMFKKRKDDEPASCWVICSRIATCWALPPFMRMCGMSDKLVQQAWREKVTLCVIILVIGGMVAFLTVGFSLLLCPASERQGVHAFLRYGDGASQGKPNICYALRHNRIARSMWRTPERQNIYREINGFPLVLLNFLRSCATRQWVRAFGSQRATINTRTNSRSHYFSPRGAWMSPDS